MLLMYIKAFYKIEKQFFSINLYILEEHLYDIDKLLDNKFKDNNLIDAH